MSEPTLYLQSKIDAALQQDAEATKFLDGLLNSAVTRNLNVDQILNDFQKYQARKLYAHSHFLAILMKRVDRMEGEQLIERNAAHYVVSRYHQAWQLFEKGQSEAGGKILLGLAEKGHLHSKKDVLIIKFRNGEMGLLQYWFSRSKLLLRGILMAYNDPTNKLLIRNY